ncbi:aspartyl protease family protein [Pseudoalteromonas sp. SMS1]|uniref:aspartyl protease family protein n=1 Tax=Pseudoalteromonas sp. SMS1 TaxID=2908894 RepID=UPI001F2AD7C7|nr:aspartyl protease family protein [Pseudoalteromonas sp. SMS1]MCF2858475.1 aspartyl protease family protein [Pseudoalteromonas sp. SMS1]
MKHIIILLGVFLHSFTYAAVTPWLDFTYQNGLITIPVKVSDIDSYAVLDTGAGLNAINANFVTAHKLKYKHSSNVNIEGAFASQRNKVYQKVPVSFFGINTNLEGLPEIALGNPNNSILFGRGFFKLFNTQIDYPNRRIRLLTHDHLDLKQYENIDFKIQKGYGQPIVKVELEGDSAWMLLDTGFTGGIMIERRYADKFGWLDTENEKMSFSGVNSTGETEHIKAKEVKFGAFSLSDVSVTFPAKGSKANIVSQYSATKSHVKGVKVKGIVGYEVFKHFVMTMDMKDGHLHISAPKSE